MSARATAFVLFAIVVSATAFTIPDLSPPKLLLRDEFEARRHLLDDQAIVQLEFWIALNEGDIEGMRDAYNKGADPEDKTEPTGYRPIHLAASIGNLEALRLLIDYGVDVNAQTENGTTALHYAANHGDVLVTSLLLANEADPDIADSRGFVPLHFASYANQYQFEQATSAMNDGDYYSITKEASTEVSVTSAARSKSSIPGMGEFLGCVEMLVSFGADVNAKTMVKETALHYTPAFDQYEITEVLIDAGADVNAVDVEKETPLHEATAYGAVGVTQLLLLNGADPTFLEQNGLTAAEFICRCLTYQGDPSLTQCAPGKCVGEYDRLVLEHVFAVQNGEGK